MPDTMTLPEKLRSAARSPDSWDLPGLLADAADSLEIAADAAQKAYRSARFVSLGAPLIGPEDDGDDEDDEHNRLIADLVAKGNQLSNVDNCRREVVPGWTLDELLAREG